MKLLIKESGPEARRARARTTTAKSGTHADRGSTVRDADAGSSAGSPETSVTGYPRAPDAGAAVRAVAPGDFYPAGESDDES